MTSDPWNHEKHDLGSRSHREALAACWRIAAEIVRRNPDRLAATHGYFNDQYDVVEVVDVIARRTATFLNANGTGASVGTGMRWPLIFDSSRDPRDWYVEFERRAGLPSPSRGLPPSTPQALTARWTAAFLSLNVASRTSWSTLTERTVSYFTDLPPRSTWSPAVQSWARANPDRQELLIHLSANEEEKPSISLSPDGDLWHGGAHIQLTDLHTSGSPITALVARSVPDLIP